MVCSDFESRLAGHAYVVDEFPVFESSSFGGLDDDEVDPIGGYLAEVDVAVVGAHVDPDHLEALAVRISSDRSAVEAAACQQSGGQEKRQQYVEGIFHGA